MTRHALFRVLLSLLLLLSQQLATSHVISHWTGSIDVAAQSQPNDADGTGKVLTDQSCHKCLAFAQFGAPLGTQAFAYLLPALESLPVHGAVIAAAHARTILAFQSRGPPQA